MGGPEKSLAEGAAASRQAKSNVCAYYTVGVLATTSKRILKLLNYLIKWH